MDIIKAMRIFVAVDENNGFAAAARALRLSRSLVSKQISMLEDHLGTRLLNRTTRQHSLTEAGRLYLDHSRSIIEQISAVDNELKERSGSPSGTLRINAPLSYGQIRIAPLLVEFMDLHPDLKLDLVLNDSFVDIVEAGFDIAIRIGGHLPSAMIARKIDEAHLGLYASTEWLVKNGPLKPEMDFSAHRCLVYSFNGQPRQWDINGTVVTPAWSLLCNNGEILRHAALDQGGLIFIPEFFVKQDVAQGRLARLDDPAQEQVLPIMAIYPHRQHLPLKVRTFLDFLVERL